MRDKQATEREGKKFEAFARDRFKRASERVSEWGERTTRTHMLHAEIYRLTVAPAAAPPGDGGAEGGPGTGDSGVEGRFGFGVEAEDEDEAES